MNLSKKITALENSRVQLDVTIPQADVSQNYQELLAKYAKNVQLPGFRKGKVPLNIFEKKYGEALKGEVAGDLIEKALGEIFEAANEFERPLPYAQPAMDKAPEFDVEKELSFTVTYDVFPNVKLETVDGFKIEVPQVSIGDAELQEELKAIQERNALVIDCNDGEKAAKDHIATVNYSELDEQGNSIAGTEREDFVFTIGSGQNIYKFDDDLIGMKKGESKDITKNYKQDFEDTELAGKSKKIRLSLTALKARKLPDLDDELAQDVNEKFKTLDDLKKDLSKNMEVALENKIKEIKSNSLLEKIIEKNDFVLPASMVKAELESRWQRMAQQFRTDTEQLERIVSSSGQTKEAMLEEWRKDSEKALKSRVIVELLFKERDITISPDDVEAEYTRIAESSGISVEEIKKHYADMRAKEYLIDDIKEQRLYTQLLEKCTLTKGAKKTFAEIFNYGN